MSYYDTKKTKQTLSKHSTHFLTFSTKKHTQHVVSLRFFTNTLPYRTLTQIVFGFLLIAFLVGLTACGARHEPTIEDILANQNEEEETQKDSPASQAGAEIKRVNCPDCDWVFRIQGENTVSRDEVKALYRAQIRFQAVVSGWTEEEQHQMLNDRDTFDGFLNQSMAIELLETELRQTNRYPQEMLDDIMPLIPGYLRQQLIYQTFINKLVTPLIDLSDEAIQACYNKHRDEFSDVALADAERLCKQEIIQNKMPSKLEQFLSVLKQEQRIIYDDDTFTITFIPTVDSFTNTDIEFGDDFGLTLEDMGRAGEEVLGEREFTTVPDSANTSNASPVNDTGPGSTLMNSEVQEVVVTPEQFEQEFQSHMYLQLVMVGVTDEEIIQQTLNDRETKRQYFKEYLHLILMERRLREADLLNDEKFAQIIDAYQPYIEQQFIMHAYMSENIMPYVSVTEQEFEETMEKVQPIYEVQGYSVQSIAENVRLELRNQKAQMQLAEHIQRLQAKYPVEMNDAIYD